MSTQSYSSYLRLPIILSSQHPLLPFEDVVGWTSERYFIVCHQVSELLMSQVLMDFEQATSLVDCSRDWANAKLLLTRAASLTVLLCRNLEQIAYLCPQSAFFAFRPALEGSSGKESLQFQKALSILSGKSSYRQTLESNLPKQVPCSSAFNHQHPSGCLCDECGVAEALNLLLDGIALWRYLHLIIAKEFIGNLPGTGGTIGYKYLEKRIEHDSAESQQSFYAKKASQLPAETSPEITLNHMWAWLNSIEDRIRRLQSLKSL